MKVKIKRIDKELPLPVYETEGSVAFDIICRKDTVIEPKAIERVPGNVIIDVPDGYALIVASRSSTPSKKSLWKPHGIGIVDQDYCGDKDEIMMQMYNFSDESVTVKRGEKIAQGMFVKVGKAEWVEVDEMRKESRGGFGSTG